MFQQFGAKTFAKMCLNFDILTKSRTLNLESLSLASLLESVYVLDFIFYF